MRRSPTNTTYNSNSVLVHVQSSVLSGFTNTFFNYSIDGLPAGNIPTVITPHSPVSATIDGNVTLILSNGSHYISVYGHFDSPLGAFNENGTVYFTIDDSNPLPTSSPNPTPSSSPTSKTTPTPQPNPTPTPPAPAIPKPAIPEFTIKFRESKTIELTIKNQPFDRSFNYSLYYNIRYRVDSDNWSEVYRPDDGYPTQSSSDYTILSFSSSNEYEGYFLDTSTNPPWSFAIIAPANSVLNVQVEAMIGYIHRVYNPNATDQLSMYPYVFTGETSGWSNTQTITIPEPSPSPSLPPSPSIPEFPSFIIVSFLMMSILLGALFHSRRLRKINNKRS